MLAEKFILLMETLKSHAERRQALYRPRRRELLMTDDWDAVLARVEQRAKADVY